MRSIIVSGGDAKYFDMLAELVSSIRKLKEGKSHPVAMLDGGLTEKQISWFKSHNVQVVKPKWPCKLAELKANGRDYLKINLAKPCLNEYFPDYDVQIWLDGDTWLQNWDAINMLEHVAMKGKLAVVSEASRYNYRTIQFKRRWFGLVELRNILFKNSKRSGLSCSDRWLLAGKPTLNAGSYALKKDAPHWASMQKYRDIVLASPRSRPFTSDQLAMGMAVYKDGLPFEPLPETCNYMGPWRYNEKTNQFHEMAIPYNVASVVHLAGTDLGRKNGALLDAVDMDDKPIKVSIRYRDNHSLI